MPESEAVSEATNESAALKAEVKRLKAENAQLAKDVEALNDRCIERESQLRKVNRELNDDRHDAKDAKEELKKLRDELKSVEGARDQFAAQLREVEVDRDAWKTKYEAAPHELQAEVDKLRTRLREVDHRKAFDRLAREAKVTDPDKLEDLYALSGHRPDSDDVDVAKLGEMIQRTISKRPWLVDQAAPGGTAVGGSAVPPASNGATPVTPSSPAPGGAPGSNPNAIAGSAAAVAPGSGHPAPGQGTGKPGPGSDRGESVSHAIPGFPALKPGQIPGRL